MTAPQIAGPPPRSDERTSTGEASAHSRLPVDVCTTGPTCGCTERRMCRMCADRETADQADTRRSPY